MKATQMLHELGQSLWLDNITRDLLDSETLKRYIDELSVTGLTSNPTIFDHAIKNSAAYDAAIRHKVKEGKAGEPLFFELALEDLTRAAVLAQFAKAGVDVDALAAQLQDEGAKSFVKSWHELLEVIASKSADLRKAS
jgi:transaldolase